ncbi:response regulator [Pseudomonas sp. Marseille-QA0892]
MNTRALHYTNEAPMALVVEDELSVRELICELLHDEGIQTIPLETIDDGLAYLQDHASGLSMMVLDVRTPGVLDGLQLAEIAEQRWPHIPVLLTSGYTGRSASIPKGATFLSKPWTVGAFLQAVHAVLHRATPANDD